MSSERFTIEVRRASRKISRSSRLSSSRAAKASRASATETRIPLLRKRFANSRIFFCIAPPPPRPPSNRLVERPLLGRRGRRRGLARRRLGALLLGLAYDQPPEFALRLPDVPLVLQDHVQSLAH